MAQYFTASDGAKIAFRDQGSGTALLCLAGLTRTMADFDYLLPHLPSLRVICMDYRGRGQSDWTGPASYTPAQESKDALELLDHLRIQKAAVLGTSRGGIIGMLLAAFAKHRLLGLCLNDIGPQISQAGLHRIAGYLGHNPVAKTHSDLARDLPGLMTGFANVPQSRWQQEAQKHYTQTNNGLQITYDPALRQAFVTAMNAPQVDLWPFFEAAQGLPLAVIRGANSDLLLSQTVTSMQARRPDMLCAEIPDRAHIPFLDEVESVLLIRNFIALLANERVA
jgi:pimeloyl-ACP methyl ester carboxylesterase